MDPHETSLLGAIQLGLPVVAATTWAPDHGVDRIRLNHNGARGGAQSYSAGFNDIHQYVQIASVTPLKWCAVETQGRPDADQWLTSYLVQYSMDGKTWFAVDSARIFTANQDRNSRHKNTFFAAVEGRALRIVPISWHSHISFRCEFYFEDELSKGFTTSCTLHQKNSKPAHTLEMSDVVGEWKGDWGSGPLHVSFRDDGTGHVTIPGHSAGPCIFRLNGEQLIATIERQDGLKQGFMVVLAGKNRLEGTYVHFNNQSFSDMWLASDRQ